LTTSVLCTVPQGLTGVPLGPGSTPLNLTPPIRTDSHGVFLLTPPQPFVVAVDPVAWGLFASAGNPASAAYQQFLTPQGGPGSLAPLIPLN